MTKKSRGIDKNQVSADYSEYEKASIAYREHSLHTINNVKL